MNDLDLHQLRRVSEHQRRRRLAGQHELRGPIACPLTAIAVMRNATTLDVERDCR
jgi:hypothetical protein